MAGRRRPHATSRRPGRRHLPISVWWRRLQHRWQACMTDAFRALHAWR